MRPPAYSLPYAARLASKATGKARSFVREKTLPNSPGPHPAIGRALAIYPLITLLPDCITLY